MGKSLFQQMKSPSFRRKTALYGWFGRAVNITDGKYTYFQAPKDELNSPLYLYGAMPTTIWRYYGEEYALDMEMGRYLPYTNYPVYRIPINKESDISGPIKYIMQSELYDIQADYLQLKPIIDINLTEKMRYLLVRAMIEHQSPAEQYQRLGLEKEFDRIKEEYGA